jgi:hypothetical protein
VEKRIGKRPGGPWYASYKTRIIFELNAIKEYPSLRASNRRQGSKLWRQYNVNIFHEDYDVNRFVTIKIFPTAATGAPPEVTVDGPEDSPHRYDKGELCMWYPWTVKTERWIFEDGLLMLLVMVEAHLFREAWWRETGEWLGPEKSHAEIEAIVS